MTNNNLRTYSYEACNHLQFSNTHHTRVCSNKLLACKVYSWAEDPAHSHSPVPFVL